MLWHEIFRKRRAVLIVHSTIFHRRIPRIVRSRKGHIGKERFVLLIILKKFYRCVREKFAGELLADTLVNKLAAGRKIDNGDFRMIRHTPEEYRLPLLKAPQK